MAVAGVLLMNGQTAADEDAGRMEAYLAQPITRAALFLGRGIGVLAWLAAIGVLMLVPPLAGYERYVITGDSMAGSIPRGAIAYARVVPVGDLRVGDVIVRIEDRDDKGRPKIGAVFEADGKRQFGIPLSRAGEIREPGKKGVRRNATPSVGE